MGLFDNHEITLSCPGCGHKFKETLGRVQHKTAVDCPKCKQRIGIDASNLRQGLKSADKAMDDLRRTLKNLGKR